MEDFRKKYGKKKIDINEEIQQIRIMRGKNDIVNATRLSMMVRDMLDYHKSIEENLSFITESEYSSDEVRQMDEEVGTRVMQLWSAG